MWCYTEKLNFAHIFQVSYCGYDLHLAIFKFFVFEHFFLKMCFKNRYMSTVSSWGMMVRSLLRNLRNILAEVLYLTQVCRYSYLYPLKEKSYAVILEESLLLSNWSGIYDQKEAFLFFCVPVSNISIIELTLGDRLTFTKALYNWRVHLLFL